MTKYVLPLTPFEESLLGDNQPAYPWNILQRLRLDGAVDRARFKQAVLVAWQRHVLLRSRVRRTWLGRFVWESYEATAWHAAALESARARSLVPIASA